MNSIDILEELKEFFDKMDYEAIKHKPEEYIQAISNLIAENKELKGKNKRQQENLKIANKKIAAQRGQLMMLNKAYIPKSKVIEVIEELSEELEIMKVDNMYGRYKEYGGKKKWEEIFQYKYGKHDVLQSLLGKE